MDENNSANAPSFGGDEEQKVLENLINPDAIRKPKYSWDDNFQRRIIGLILTDNYFLIQASSLVLPEYFVNEVHGDIANICFDFFTKYKGVPQKFIVEQLLLEKIKNRDDTIKLYYKTELENIYENFIPEIISREVLLDKIVFFAKIQALKIAMEQAQRELKNNSDNDDVWFNVYEKINKAMLVNKNFDIGFEYFLNLEAFFHKLGESTDTSEKFTSAFPKIDNSLTGGGLQRGEIYSWIALPGKGKSLALVKAAVENVKQGKKVVFITLEMDWIGICKRFTSQFTEKPHNFLMNHKDEIIDLVNLYTKELDDKNLLVVKQFPSGSIDVNDIRSFISQLQLYGYKPDMVIVDYVGEMKDFPNIPTWESKYRIIRDLRGLAMEYNFCCLTCVQPSKSAAELDTSAFIDEQNIGGSFDQFKPLDGLWSINQTNEEKDGSVARIFVIKHRNGKSRFHFHVAFNYNILSMYECTETKYRMTMNDVQARRAANVQVDPSSSMKTAEIDLDKIEDFEGGSDE
jgi:replicative DNA helicase